VERSNHVAEKGSRSESEGDDDDVSGRYGSDIKMNSAYECYVKIGTPPSPGIDTGAVSKGGRIVSLTPPVRPSHQDDEVKEMDIADENAEHVFNSESISERLYNATLVDEKIDSTNTILDSGCTRTMW
jgi:hypothetical protein